MVWFQLKGQFLFEFFKRNQFLMALMGVPISYLFLNATKYGVTYFEGQLWPQRMLGFTSGILIFTVLAYYMKGESMSLKTMISVFLAFVIVVLQVFMK